MSWPWDSTTALLEGDAWTRGNAPTGRGSEEAARQALLLHNPPGLRELSYRVGTYSSFASEMLDRLVMSLGSDTEDDGSGAPRRRTEGAAEAGRMVRFNLAAEGNWLVALTQSWASVADVLTFYQERLIQEGYLETAVEPRSVYELVHMVGYQPTPAVAGHTDLALAITDVRGLPREIELPRRLVVRSVPPPGAQSQVFETLAPLRARTAWNVLRPDPRRRKMTPIVHAGAVSLPLHGVATGLIAGAPLLVTGQVVLPVPKGEDAEDAGDAGDAGGELRDLASVRRLLKVEPAKDSTSTAVSWQEPLSLDLVRRRPGQPAPGEAERLDALAQIPVAGATIHALPGQAGLFGRAAPDWASLPPQVKRQAQGLPGGVVVEADDLWTSRNVGIPVEATVISLAADREHLYAGTLAHGVFHSTDEGATWKPSQRGLPQLDAPALTVDSQGVVWSGGTSGGVYRSTDHGEIWEDASGRQMATAVRSLGSRLWPFGKKPVGGALPGAAIHDLLTLKPSSATGGEAVVLAATGAGVYRSIDGGRSWLPSNRGLPGVEPPAGTSDLAVRRLTGGGATGEVWAATLRGVFVSTDGGQRWKPRNRGLPKVDPFTGFSATQALEVAVIAGRRQVARILVGTDSGLYLSDDGGEHWRHQPLVPLSGDRAAAPSLGPPIFETPVTSLRLVEDPTTLDRRVHAAANGDLWTSRDDGESWTRERPFPGSPILALASGDGNALALAAVPFGAFADEWPGFHLQEGQIDLEGVVDGVVPGSWLVLVPGGAADPTAAAACAVLGVTQMRRQDFGLDSMITRIQVRPDPRLTTFDLRDTRVFLHSRVLELQPEAVLDHSLALRVLGVSLRSLPPTRRVIATGDLPALHHDLKLQVDTDMANLAKAVERLENLASDLVVTLCIWPVGERPAPNTEPGSLLQLPVADLLAFLRGLLDVRGDLAAALGAEGGEGHPGEGASGAASVATHGGEVPSARLEMGSLGPAGPSAAAATMVTGPLQLPESMRGVLEDAMQRMMRDAVAPRGGGGPTPAGGSTPVGGPWQPAGARVSPSAVHVAAASDTPSPSEASTEVDSTAPESDNFLYLEIEVPARTVGRVTTVAELSARLLTPRTDGGSGLRIALPAASDDEEESWVGSSTLQVFGNVVAANEGNTVTDEVLGDGDATVANQVFRLAQPPSFRLGGSGGGLASGTASGTAPGGAPEAGAGEPSGFGASGTEVESTVEVRVQGQLWRRVDHLEGVDPDDRVYRLDVDQDGAGTIIFGSGDQGSRLPTGKDNVRASYTTGVSTGSVPAGGVSLPQNRPLGLDTVANPLPTVPGAAAEPADEARQAAPLSVLTLGRVISLADYADFARVYPGIAKAGAWRVPSAPPSEPGQGRRLGIQVTVAVEGGGPAAPGVLKDLRQALAAVRSQDLPLHVDDYRRVRVRVAAGLLIDPSFEWREVEEAVTRRLLQRFGFAQARFDGTISAAAVVHEAQAVPGVDAVDLDELTAYDGQVRGLAGPSASPASVSREDAPRRCVAQPPAWGDGTLRAAELLLLGDVVLHQFHGGEDSELTR